MDEKRKKGQATVAATAGVLMAGLPGVAAAFLPRKKLVCRFCGKSNSIPKRPRMYIVESETRSVEEANLVWCVDAVNKAHRSGTRQDRVLAQRLVASIEPATLARTYPTAYQRAIDLGLLEEDEADAE